MKIIKLEELIFNTFIELVNNYNKRTISFDEISRYALNILSYIDQNFGKSFMIPYNSPDFSEVISEYSNLICSDGKNIILFLLFLMPF